MIFAHHELGSQRACPVEWPGMLRKVPLEEVSGDSPDPGTLVSAGKSQPFDGKASIYVVEINLLLMDLNSRFYISILCE